MTRKKKQMWTELELKGLLEDEDSCVYWEKVQKHVSLHPYQLKNNTVALNEMLMTNLNFYDPKLNGFPLLYQNPKLLTELGEQLSDICFVHIDIEVEYYIFRPEVGKKLKGIVTKKAINHIRVIVHRAFSVAIQKPPNSEDWVGDKVRVGQEIKFTITHLDYEFKYPVFKGSLDPDNYLDGCQVFDESKNEQVDEKPVLDSTGVAKKRKKTNDSSENQDSEVVKKSKKQKKGANHEETSEVTETTDDFDYRSIKFEKVSQQTVESHQKSPKKKSKQHVENSIGETKADLKRYKKQLQETLPDLTVNEDQSDSTEKKKKKKKKKNDETPEEPSEVTTTQVSADTNYRSIKLEKVSNLESATKEKNNNSSNHERIIENLQKSPKKKSKQNDVEINSIGETKADLKRYKKQLQETLPDLTVNEDQPDSTEKKKKKKKKDKSNEANTHSEGHETSAVDYSMSALELSHISNVTNDDDELPTEISSLSQHNNDGEESVMKKTKKKKKNKELSQDSDMPYNSETEKEYKKRLQKQILNEAAVNHETQEGGTGEKQILKKKSKKKKHAELENGDSSSTDVCHNETEKNYKKKLHKGLFSSTMIEDVEPNSTNPEESEAERKSKKELQEKLFKSPLKKSPEKSKKSDAMPIPQLNISYPDSDESCFSDSKEKMKKYKKALRKSLAIDDEEKTEQQLSPKKKTKKRKLDDGCEETAGGKVHIDNNGQPAIVTPKLEDAKSKKSSKTIFDQLDGICFEDRNKNNIVKPNQTLTPPSSDSDNVTVNQQTFKKTKKISSPSKVSSKTDSSMTTSRPIKKEKD